MEWSYRTGVPYQACWDEQEALRARVIEDPAVGSLWLVEHPPTFTLGRGEGGENMGKGLRWLRDNGFDVVETNRGGKVTYHGPGQLVAYPIVDLRTLKMGVKEYVAGLEQTMIRTLARYGIEAQSREGWIGTWVDDRKVGSIGIHVRKHVSIHGLALNVNTNLAHFDLVTPCGIQDVRMTSLADLGLAVTVPDVLENFTQSFRDVFGVALEGAAQG